MSNNAIAIIGCICGIGIVALIGWRVGTYKGQPGRGWRLHRWLVISPIVFAVVALAGCDSGQPGGKPAVSGASTATSPAQAPALPLTTPAPRGALRQPSRAPADRIATQPSPMARIPMPRVRDRSASCHSWGRTCGIPSRAGPRC